MVPEGTTWNVLSINDKNEKMKLGNHACLTDPAANVCQLDSIFAFFFGSI